MKRVLPLLLFLLVLVSPAAVLAETRLMAFSDLHYLAPEFYEGSQLFLEAIARGDGKAAHRSAELLAAFLAEVRHQRPDAVLLTGDLTFNGEKRSHEQLAAACGELWDEGIPVWVIPGNHDINNTQARSFDGESVLPAEYVTREQFGEIWRRCLGQDRPERSFTYMAPVNGQVRLAMLDVSIYTPVTAAPGLFTLEHEAWLETALAAADAAGAAVITATHQSLLQQAVNGWNEFGIHRAEEMKKLLRAHGVRLNLSGHVHIHHAASEDGLTDAAAGAFSVSPHRWNLITVGDDGSVRVEGRTICPEHVPEGFLQETAAFYVQTVCQQLLPSLRKAGVGGDELRQMISFAVRFNTAYFSGTLDVTDPAWKTDPGWALWTAAGEGSGFGRYIEAAFAWEEARIGGTD